MIVDNFNLFKKIINPYNDDEFYFVQILIRGKDGHIEQGVNGSNKNCLIKFFQHFPDIDVHKNNPTLLYFNCLE